MRGEDLLDLVKPYGDELVALRRDIHAHPELGRAEVRTTRLVRQRLTAAGLEPRVLPGGTGLVCDVGRGSRAVAVRADLDALPIPDEKHVPYRSTVAGVCHACGHDIHTAIVVGVGLVLADLERAGRLPGRARLIFQPAEESAHGGAHDVIAAEALHEVERVFAVHCDPRSDVGEVGLRPGPITSAADQVAVRLRGAGGHTARPHLTADLVFALAKVVTELPAALSRRVDPRAGLSVVWGRVAAGTVANVIPEAGEVAGTVRCLDPSAWEDAPDLVRGLVDDLVAPYGVDVDVEYTRGVPPVVNDVGSTALLREAAVAALGGTGVVETEQSLGGEDFAWYLERVPGALARLGVHTPGERRVHDLHQGGFDADERAITVGVRLLSAAALLSFR